MLMVIGDRSFLDADDEDDIVYVGCATIGLSIGTSPIDTSKLLIQIAKLWRVEKEPGSMPIVMWMQ